MHFKFKFLTVNANIVVAVTFSIAFIVNTFCQALQKKLSAVIFTFYRNIEVPKN